MNVWFQWALRIIAICCAGASAYYVNGSRYGNITLLAFAEFFGLLAICFAIFSTGAKN
jgi:hypothetical protein